MKPFLLATLVATCTSMTAPETRRTTLARRATLARGLGAGGLAVGAWTQRASPARASAGGPIRLPFAVLPESVREPVFAACSSSPAWLEGEWTVDQSVLVGVVFPKFGWRGPPAKTIGARVGSCLALPNIGATPKGYAQRFSSDRDADAVYNAAQALEAFFPEANVVEARVVSPGRHVVKFEAPTVSKGRQRQRADAERLSCSWALEAEAALLVETFVQSTVLDTQDDVYSGLFGRYTTWRLFERTGPDTLRIRLRIAAFDAGAPPGSCQPDAVYDYTFALRRRDTPEGAQFLPANTANRRREND
ncbi:hypothetical protein M885DRAFT_613312 [Pelagophyceae sp. CCMP2097]|nr:hypothetical protein M885DRAFT_613312 [Pelagophyceae sp. CCMP2097]